MNRVSALLGLVLALLAVLTPSAVGASPGVVVSQVYAGGGNAGATYANDFVELFNPSRRKRRSQRLDAPVRERREHQLVGDPAQWFDCGGPVVSGSARIDCCGGFGAADAGCDGYDQPRGIGRQDRARPGCDGAQLRRVAPEAAPLPHPSVTSSVTAAPATTKAPARRPRCRARPPLSGTLPGARTPATTRPTSHPRRPRPATRHRRP